jgi:hypothetical protein
VLATGSLPQAALVLIQAGVVELGTKVKTKQRVKQQIAHFSDADASVSLGIVYDVSGSMKERISRSMRALKRFIETPHDDDDFFLMAFNDRATLVRISRRRVTIYSAI